jgi:galactonate dehydratase
MKITDLKTYVTMPKKGLPWVFAEVHTDEGVTGLGEGTNYNGNVLVAQGLRAARELVIGLDPANIEEIWQRIFRHYTYLGGRGLISGVVSAIDIALWDIKGKVLGVPIYQLLGGKVRDRVPLYTHIQDAWYEGVTIPDAVQAAKATKKAGYHAFKTDPFKWARNYRGPFQGADAVERLTPQAIEEAMDWMRAVREAVGPEYELMVDAHGRFDVATGTRIARALEPINLIWLEEPVPPESWEALRQVRESTNIPICVGERLFTRYDFVPVFTQRLADYVMPDVAWTGGISELRRIAAMAESFYVRVSPHDALGPVAIMASFHVSIASPNLYRQECLHMWFDDFKEIVRPMFDYHDGAIWPSDRPGLGIELDHEGVARYALDPCDPRTSNIRSWHAEDNAAKS